MRIHQLLSLAASYHLWDVAVFCVKKKTKTKLGRIGFT